MSPQPLIELQRRLAEAGRVRMGEKSDKGAPKRLSTWRITSPTQDLINQAAELYGGEPKPWESPTGPQWEVVTTTADLPVLVMPGYSFRQQYEHRTSPTLVERRCDGTEMDDGQPCLCNAAGGNDVCQLITRLTIALPELTTMLGWRLETKGENAARELLASMDLVQGVSQGRPFVPARLRIVERRGNVNGQAVRYVVPVVDVAVRYSELVAGASERKELTYTPVVKQLDAGVTLEQGLAGAAASGEQKVSRARSAAPIPQADAEIGFGEAPVPVPPDTPSPGDSLPGGTPELATEKQRRLIFAQAKEWGVDKDGIKQILLELTGQESTAAIPKDRVEDVLRAIVTAGVPA